MKKTILLIFIMFALAIFQNTFFLELFESVKNPNLVLAFCFSLVILKRRNAALHSAFVGGLFLDLFGPGIIGLSSVLFLGFIFVAIFVQNYVAGNIFVVLVMLYVFAVIYPGLVSFSLIPKAGTVLVGGVITLVMCIVFYILNSKYVTPISSNEYSL